MRVAKLWWVLLLIGCCDARAGRFWSDDPVTNGFIISTNVLSVIDWAQTRHIADNPDEFQEEAFAENFIGKHPTTKEVNSYFTASIILTNGIGYFLPEKATIFSLKFNPKKTFYLVATAFEAYTVENNYRIGIHGQFY
jgi:hypothetical protein